MGFDDCSSVYGRRKPSELAALPLMRARFCELLDVCTGGPESASDPFLLGLLLAMDAILHMPMSDVLKEIAVGGEIRNALLGKSNALLKIWGVVLNSERGNWDEISQAAAGLCIGDKAITERYLKSVDWAQQVVSGHDASELKPA
jgi:c-di-GMP-related signal transduction protein